MVVISQNPTMKMEKIRDDIELPIINLCNRSEAMKEMVKACEEYGFFKVINHGVPQGIISQVEEEARGFFAKPGPEKMRAGPPYGCKNIGLQGDVGEVEYLILQTNSPFIIPTDESNKFRSAINAYVEAVRKLACDILDLLVEGVCGSEGGSALSRLMRDSENDSILRLNHYPAGEVSKIGFGEHTDPQIITLLRSNGVEGLQISVQDGLWVPVNPYPDSAFCVNVGDILQVMTNGRFVSVKHRVAVQAYESRMSIAYFVAPALHATVSCLPGLGLPLYRSFTWGEYKQAVYTGRLADTRLNLFALPSHHNN
ncbi:gibberellin 2-beta-dioxygenase 4-like [Salvia miltiorrhiza]|uniref:gibberellin 2-beta-dioxygenase 4-like n=1 Tax=Salvia miltiorrhiza TaxID=226208 RepID=UPI0025AD74F6|nr:gibberellin 2-beta-dioxygenase 4-like [Salvia miltiorrhiza]